MSAIPKRDESYLRAGFLDEFRPLPPSPPGTASGGLESGPFGFPPSFVAIDATLTANLTIRLLDEILDYLRQKSDAAADDPSVLIDCTILVDLETRIRVLCENLRNLGLSPNASLVAERFGWLVTLQVEYARQFRPGEVCNYDPPAKKVNELHAIIGGLATELKRRFNWEADENGPVATHGPDFRSVNWYGTCFEFTSQQAAVVKVLWEAMENGTPTVGDPTLLEAVESGAGRLPNLFRDHPAWGRMIVEGGTKGSRRLADPPQ